MPELTAFAEVASRGSISAAATALSLTQGGVSRVVQRLEERVGRALFVRGAGGVALTPDGERLLEQVVPALALLSEGMRACRREQSQTLRVSVIPTVNTHWLIRRLPRFRERFPHIHLVLRPYLSDDDFLRADVDCWVQTRRQAGSRWPAHMRARYVFGREIVPICHPAQVASIGEPHDLLAHPLLYHVNYPDNWALWLKAAHVTQPHALASGMDTVGALIEAVSAGMGVAVVQRALLEAAVQAGRVAMPLPLEVSTGRGYYFCAARARETEPAIQAFGDWLAECAHEESPIPFSR
jgi:LysR family glycine cleavage system transcriptional activator